MRRIFIYPTQPAGREGPLIAVAEDGTVLVRHWALNDAYLGYLDPKWSRHYVRAYEAHYPDGYEIVRVEAKDVATCADLQAAMTKARARPHQPASGNFVSTVPDMKAGVPSSGWEIPPSD